MPRSRLLIGLLIVAAGMAVMVQPEKGTTMAGLQSFSSYSELNSYLEQNPGTRGRARAPMCNEQATASADAAQSYSTTNVQVTNVQEEDRVLTDGTYHLLRWVRRRSASSKATPLLR